MSEFSDLLKKLIETGADPNVLQKEFEGAVSETQLWALWGDGKWRENLVCSKCGSAYGGVCCDPGTKGQFFSDDPGYHHNQPRVTMITYKEWEQKMAGQERLLEE